MRRYFTRETALDEAEAIDSIRVYGHLLKSKADLQPLMERIGDSRIVMLGEASHGTHEYYMWRAYISRRLIEEKGFNFIAVEGDWPECYRLNRFVKGYDRESSSAFDVLNGFNRWPTWMWANWEIVALADWLLKHNTGLAKNRKAGFYGLDVYSLWESMENIMQYLRKTDPAALQAAEEAFRCFEPFRKDTGTAYARATQFVPDLCKEEVVVMLRKIRERLPGYDSDPENVFSAEQNALVAAHAEEYYRTMIEGGPHSWNLRDRHMADTLERLLAFHGPDAKGIVWAHNTHVGDARATDMTDEGMFNIGELARLEHPEKEVVLVGFGSYSGSVMAGRGWGAAMQSMELPEAKSGSWEDLLRRSGTENRLLIMDDLASGYLLMEHRIGHRAVGVVYNPAYERYGNYVPSILPLRYDAFIYLDETKGLHPLHLEPHGHQVPQTYPFGV